MTETTARAALVGIKAQLAAATPGPWDWYGNTDTRTIYLATKDRGRQFVMTFRRWGMQGAQPWFNTNMMMSPASDRPRYEVAPDATSRDDRAVYRADIAGIKHPDAVFIAAAPATVARLTAALEAVLALHVEDVAGDCEECRSVNGDWVQYPCQTASAIENALKEAQ